MRHLNLKKKNLKSKNAKTIKNNDNNQNIYNKIIIKFKKNIKFHKKNIKLIKFKFFQKRRNIQIK